MYKNCILYVEISCRSFFWHNITVRFYTVEKLIFNSPLTQIFRQISIWRLKADISGGVRDLWVFPVLCLLSVAPHCQKTPRTDGKEEKKKDEKKNSLGGAAHSFAAVRVHMCIGDYILPSNINQRSSA